MKSSKGRSSSGSLMQGCRFTDGAMVAGGLRSVDTPSVDDVLEWPFLPGAHPDRLPHTASSGSSTISSISALSATEFTMPGISTRRSASMRGVLRASTGGKPLAVWALSPSSGAFTHDRHRTVAPAQSADHDEDSLVARRNDLTSGGWASVRLDASGQLTR